MTADAVLLEPVAGESAGEPPREPEGDIASQRNKPHLRQSVSAKHNVERLQPIEAKYVRMTIQATNSSQPCIDELEIFAGETNVALAANGGKASSSGDFVHRLHKLAHINDGNYGNSKSWIASTRTGGWIQIELAEPRLISRIEWARDRTGGYSDRLATEYVIKVSLDGEHWTAVADASDRLPFSRSEQPRYDFEAFPESLAEQGRATLEALNQAVARRDTLARQTLVYAGTFTQPGPTHRLYRGEPEARREEVSPGAIAALGELALSRGSPEQERRRSLAEWIASPANPLTARVLVNRLWLYHFGTGIRGYAKRFWRQRDAANAPGTTGLAGCRTHR